MKETAAAAAVTPDINARIAGCVRALRTDLGMTLDALAAKCDVSRSMISLVERGESSPTAVVLEKIAAGLGVPLATLFDGASASADPVSRREDRTPWRDPQSGYVRRNISPASVASPIQGNACRWARITPSIRATISAALGSCSRGRKPMVATPWLTVISTCTAS